MAEVLGTDDGDILEGGDESDVLIGGLGSDLLIGGAGADLYVFAAGDSTTGDGLFDPSFLDAIVDFEPSDRLLFMGANAPVFGSLKPGTADDFEGALALAQEAFDNGFEYASIKVEADVYVFALRIDTVVKLEGVDASQIAATTISSGDPEQGLVEFGSKDGDARAFAAGANVYDAGNGADTVQGGIGTDSLIGGSGDDEVYGGDGDDSVGDGAGANYLRGEAGDDAVTGGADFDDINGNMGRDTLHAGAGDDWVRGGKDDDIVFAGEGHDLAFGDLGSDTVGGGLGDDVVRGGAGDDVLRGDDGEDTLHGEAGDDTLDGGIGADVFVFGEGSGGDRVARFNAGEGDRVVIAEGVDVEVSQEGDDVVITAADGGQMVLAGVNLQSLPENWLTGG